MRRRWRPSAARWRRGWTGVCRRRPLRLRGCAAAALPPPRPSPTACGTRRDTTARHNGVTRPALRSPACPPPRISICCASAEASAARRVEEASQRAEVAEQRAQEALGAAEAAARAARREAEHTLRRAQEQAAAERDAAVRRPADTWGY
jgi:hypothetical protein